MNFVKSLAKTACIAATTGMLTTAGMLLGVAVAGTIFDGVTKVKNKFTKPKLEEDNAEE